MGKSQWLTAESRDSYVSIVSKLLERVLKRTMESEEYLPDPNLLRELRQIFPPLEVDPVAVAAYMRSQLQAIYQLFEYVLEQRYGVEITREIMLEVYGLSMPPEKRMALEAGAEELVQVESVLTGLDKEDIE